MEYFQSSVSPEDSGNNMMDVSWLKEQFNGRQVLYKNLYGISLEETCRRESEKETSFSVAEQNHVSEAALPNIKNLKL